MQPLIFPGGNIGDLAIHGTVNDLAMCGARPFYLSAGFILEEGLSMDTLRTVVTSMQEAAAQAKVQLVTGDTKVVDKGKGDDLFLNTSGIGLIEANVKAAIGPASVQVGDSVIVSGDLGRHGIAILSVRQGLEFESPILSDSANLWPAVEALLNAGIDVHCLRDLTRGGLAAGAEADLGKTPRSWEYCARCIALQVVGTVLYPPSTPLRVRRGPERFEPHEVPPCGTVHTRMPRNRSEPGPCSRERSRGIPLR